MNKIYLAHDKKHLIQSSRKDLITYDNGEPILDENGKKQYKWALDYRHDKNGNDIYANSPIENQNDSWKSINNFFIPKDFFIGIMGESYYFSIPTKYVDEANLMNFKTKVRYSKAMTYIIAIPRKFILNKRTNKHNKYGNDWYTIGVLNHFTYWITAIYSFNVYLEAVEIIKNGYDRKAPSRQKHLWNDFKAKHEMQIVNYETKERKGDGTLHVFHQTMEVKLRHDNINWFRLALREIHKETYNEYWERKEANNRFTLFKNWLSKSKHFSTMMIAEILGNVDWMNELQDEWIKVVSKWADTTENYWCTNLFKQEQVQW